jgi:hypothetical protein
MDQQEDQSYELHIRLLGNEVFGVKLSTTSTSNRWVLISLLSIFMFLTIIGAYGEKFIQLYQWLIA